MISPGFTSAEIERYRSDTPGASNVLHFNNAGASLPVRQVLDTVISYLNEEALNGGYETEDRYKDKIEAVYSSVARLINAETTEIALMENASAAWCIAFHGISFSPGDEVLTSEFEYVTNVMGFIHAQQRYGIRLRVIPNDESGNFSLEELRAAINPKTRLIAVTHIGSATGGVLPLVEIGKIAKEKKILFLVDACQTVGQMPIDVKAIGCDLLSATGRKFLRAPRGTGFLFMRKDLQQQLNVFIMDGHSAMRMDADKYQLRADARRFELYERNRATMLGFGAAIEYAMEIGLERIARRVQYLADALRQKLRGVSNVIVHDKGNLLCGIVTFSVLNKPSTDLKNKLKENGINVTVGTRSSTIYFMEKHGLHALVRASVHYYNSEAEIERFIQVLYGLVMASQECKI